MGALEYSKQTESRLNTRYIPKQGMGICKQKKSVEVEVHECRKSICTHEGKKCHNKSNICSIAAKPKKKIEYFPFFDSLIVVFLFQKIEPSI